MLREARKPAAIVGLPKWGSIDVVTKALAGASAIPAAWESQQLLATVEYFNEPFSLGLQR